MTIVVEPDPPREGERVTITATGPGPYFYRVNGGDWIELPVDEESRSTSVEVPAGSGGQILDVSDRNLPDSDDSESIIVSG